MDPNTNNPDPYQQQPPTVVSPSAGPPVPPQPQATVSPTVSPDVSPQPAVSDWNNASPAAAQPQVVVSPDVTPNPAAPVTPVVPGGAPAPGAVTSGDFSASQMFSPQSPQAPPAGPFTAPSASAYGSDGGVLPPAPSSGSGLFKKLLIVLAAVLVIGGGSAAAYFGAIVPNKPANVLKTALVNSLQQKQTSFKGTLEANSGTGGLAVKADINGASNSVAKTADLQLNLTVSGINFPVETRLVKNNVYVKIGDLSTIANLLGAYSPDAGSLATTLSGQISNKWIVIDSTLLDESGASCVLNTNWGLTQADIQLLENQYSKNPFVTIQSTSSDSVDGQKAEKFVLSIDDDKATAYGNSKTLDNLSIVKSIEKCDKSAATLPNTPNATGDHGKTPITVWVDKSTKRIVKLAFQDSGAKAKQSGASGSFTTTISYKPVTITAPQNAEPAIQVLTDVEKDFSSNPGLANLFSGLDTGSNTGTSDTLSQ